MRLKNLSEVTPQLPEYLGIQLSATSLCITPASDAVFPFELTNDEGAGPTTADTLRVVVANDQVLPVSQSGTWNIADITGTVSLPTGAATSANQDTANTALAAIETAVGGTLDVSVSASVLPTGAATEATLLSASTTLVNVEAYTQSIDSATAALVVQLPATIGQKAAAASLAVVLASDTALPLPTGAATSANQDTTNSHLTSAVVELTGIGLSSGQSATSLGNIDTNIGIILGNTPAVGQAVMASSSPVAIASDQSTLPVTVKGRASVELIRNDYTSTSVTTAAYVELVASTSATINQLDVFDSSGQTLVLAIGAAASEVDTYYITPGGNGKIELNIPTGSRVSVKAVSATADVGELTITALS